MSTRAQRSRAEATDELLVGPIRGDLLGADHLAARARAVARGQRLVAGRLVWRPALLLARLTDTRRILTDAHARLSAAAAQSIDAGPAAEWLLDNYHVVQEHLQEVRASLPGSYYRELPELASGPLVGYPRVYEMAISLISHTEARVHPENVDLYVAAFQSVTPLSIGELWALPAMLRIGLIESVRRMTLRTMQRLDDSELAARWAQRILGANARDGEELRAALREFADAEHALTPHFVSRLLQLLRQAEGMAPPVAWIEQWMREAGASPENAVAQSTHRLALTQIMMANSITSLRHIGRRDWKTFVEHQSAMEAQLREDPSGYYAQMTFATRDSYRHEVERIARRTTMSEAAVAAAAVDLARRNGVGGSPDTDPRFRHVGYYLVDDGLDELEQRAGYLPTLTERVERGLRAHPNVVFIGGLTLSTIVALLTALLIVQVHSGSELWLILLFTFFPALDISVSALNQVVTTWLPPRMLPRLDLHERGVPPQYRTAVVVPTLFSSVADVHQALEHLEVQYLANREDQLHFAVLSDFVDAASEVMPDDDAMLDAAHKGIRALNERYGNGDPVKFFWLHRPRRWNPQQGVWMGWERKRGKLSDFNRLLRGDRRAAFSVIVADAAILKQVKFVITLDADTVLPPETAASLVGAMAHPLNRAVYEAERHAVVAGYGILQPRVGVSLPSTYASRFATIASGHPGVDPYTTAVSDVYQDLFGEGSYTGKGIYDVEAFQLATHGRFPENTLLSHDLIEGNYARAGLATDVIVYDDFPSTYEAWTRRKHRWIRGDWQLLPWLRRVVPGPDGRERNRLSMLSRWKIVDNLRRSMVELAQLSLLIAGWTILPGSVVSWTLLGLGAIAAPWVTSLLLAVIRPPLDKSWRAYYVAVAADARVSAQQFFMTLALLPHQAWSSLDAIVRTLYRLLISRRNLLEWKSASHVERVVAGKPATVGRSLYVIAWLVLLGGAAYTAFVVRAHAPTATSWTEVGIRLTSVWILALLWTGAPALASRLSRSSTPERRALSPDGRAHALRYAALHWKFFDRFVSEATHWLPPDNFQNDPNPVVAMRTSPTNIGLQLLATVSAHDLELIGIDEMTTRLERTFATLKVLARYRGHFFNWYDLHDLRVLNPPYISTVDSGNMAGHLIALRQACLQKASQHEEHRAALEAIAAQADTFVREMEFAFLYDDERSLFTIGYHPDSSTADDSFYDLLASEARLASYMAIARGDVPAEHWFRLSRTLNRTGGSTALVSWSGSMFEYLMPLLVMRSLPFTLLDQSCRSVFQRQLAYGHARRVPWGVSECAYNVRDREQTYQYQAFGVPDLALKRGLDRELVIAPYASALAAHIDPPRSIANLRALEALGALGETGFCDSLDYTRPANGQRFALVHTWMAHHIGMTLVSLVNVLRNDVWQVRFESDPLAQSVSLLLHERVPRRLVMQSAQEETGESSHTETDPVHSVIREVNPQLTNRPRVALLGTTPYTVMVNHNGSGYSLFESLAVNRWCADGTRDDAGQFCYVRDIAENRVWSAAHQPVGAPADWSRVNLESDRVTFHRTDGDIATRMEITVVAADAAEVRRISVTNTGREPRDIELTSYGEVVLAPPASDRAHAAFSNLFIETEWHEWCSAITATRRPRSPDEPRLWCVHVVDSSRERVGPVTCETDRSRFIGRGRSVRTPAAMQAAGPLSGTTGAVLDPVFALRTVLHVAPGQCANASFTTLVAPTRELAFQLADRYHDSHAAQRAFDFAWTSTQVELRESHITPSSAAVYQEFATQLLFQGGSLAPPVDEVRRNLASQSNLWAHGISGDVPIVLATIESVDGLPTLRELFVAHRYWRQRGLIADLVVINAQPYDYLQELRDGIREAMVSANDETLVDRAGGVFVRRRELFQPDDYLMVAATARIHITCDGRTLARVLANAEEQAALAAAAVIGNRRLRERSPSPLVAADRQGPLATIVSALRPFVGPLVTTRPVPSTRARDGRDLVSFAPEALRYANGVGGLNARGDYQMIVDDEHLPPAPWVNVIANPQGGFVVSERGTGCVWAENAHFYRLTPWHNDPVTDPASDVLYLQDRSSGDLWSATPAPIRGDGPYRVRHGAGSSVFEHEHDGIRSELVLSVPSDAAVKLSLLRLSNHSPHERRLTLTAFAEWTLGSRRDDTQYHVRTRFIPECRSLVAQNRFDAQFAEWTAFLAVSEPVTSYTADRLSFLGRNGTMERPVALQDEHLNGRTGVAADPCAALQVHFRLAPGETREISVLLGAARNEADARQLLTRFQGIDDARKAATDSIAAWNDRLSVISVRTPDPAFDAMLNKWALYQALGCRMWARAALYQSSGAYGFRDQLQDVMAFVYAERDVARAHILRATARQFVEGDVQHWWHPHSGRGVRTRFSDDLVWLPYVVHRYVQVTGDASVLEEQVPFLTMRALEANEHELYDLPKVSDEKASVYEHCLRALNKACTVGPHGLPLIGTGDWNDGMSRVGVDGKGESVWLAWFLVTTLRAFKSVASDRGDLAVATQLGRRADDYLVAIETSGWDGDWYRRAWYDDGTPMGSAQNDECRIDSIAQSWSVISQAGRQDRQAMAMRAFDTQLVRNDARLIQLLTPPFDRGSHDPGYIRGYLPGVRENGAQYTHAALWAVQATAMRGDGDRAFELFQMLNPLTHSASAEEMLRYKVEPYAIAADVYTASGQMGRGGWTWYTGSASWLYRVGLEQLLGFTKVGNTLEFRPRVPRHWTSFDVQYRFGMTVYEITVRDPAKVQGGERSVTVDDAPMTDGVIRLVDDGQRHRVVVEPLARRESAKVSA